VHPRLSKQQQRYVFADCAIRKIAPIALDAEAKQVGAGTLAATLKTHARILRKLPQLADDVTQAHDALDAAKSAIYRASTSTSHVLRSDDVLVFAAEAVESAFSGSNPLTTSFVDAVCTAAELNPKATWAAVNEMIAAL
jgi:ABC-type transporter Mla subunit MlaD